MKALLQRVIKAKISINGNIVNTIKSGVLVFIGIEKFDNKKTAYKMLNKILNYRIFNDINNKINLSVKATNKELLLVPQFTLAANTNSGTRASFSSAMEPKKAKHIYDYLLDNSKIKYPYTKSGIFAQDMQINLINDGPISFLLTVND